MTVSEWIMSALSAKRGPGGRPTQHQVIEKAVTDILHTVGEDVSREGLLNTPNRVARALTGELLAGYSEDPAEILQTTFTHEHYGMVCSIGIPLYSLCEHHMLPFYGEAHVGYIPKAGRVVGISKIGRLVDAFSRRLQIQEHLVDQIADAFMEHVEPRGVGVVIRAEHMCMTMRGVRKPGTVTVTTAMRGVFEDSDVRREFMEHIYGGQLR